MTDELARVKAIGKWTPGPWQWDCDPMKNDAPYNRVRYRVVALGRTITQMYYSGTERSQAHADARLIAAAPALAEALRMLYENTADYIRINHLGDVHHNRDMQLARDALKAAGVE